MVVYAKCSRCNGDGRIEISKSKYIQCKTCDGRGIDYTLRVEHCRKCGSEIVCLADSSYIYKYCKSCKDSSASTGSQSNSFGCFAIVCILIIGITYSILIEAEFINYIKEGISNFFSWLSDFFKWFFEFSVLCVIFGFVLKGMSSSTEPTKGSGEFAGNSIWQIRKFLNNEAMSKGYPLPYLPETPEQKEYQEEYNKKY